MGAGLLIFIAVVAVHVVLLALIFVALARDPGAAPERRDGRQVLHPSRALLWSAAILAIWAAGGVALAVSGLVEGEAVAAMIGAALALLAGLGAAWGFARHARHRIAWDDEAVAVTDWRGTERRHLWADLAGAAVRSRGTYRNLPADGVSRLGMRELELRFADGSVVRAAPNMIGYRAFVADALARVPGRADIEP